ncbi:MAG: sensor histidine kinase, partial [Endozoicomonas sp.]
EIDSASIEVTSTDIILQSSLALLTVIDDILNVSHRDSGTSLLTEQRYNLKELLEQSLALFKTETLIRPIALNLELEPDTPEHMKGDASRVRQVIITLLGNAFKFTENGTVTLKSSYDNSTGLVTIEVSDTGTGVPEIQQDAIFEVPDSKEDGSIPPGKDNFPGLPMCRQLVELMGGNIGVQSTVNRGATFYVQLPVSLTRKSPK